MINYIWGDLKMFIFQICLILVFNEAVNAKCLLKREFGLSQTTSDPPIPVDGQASYSIDLDDCHTKCDTLVRGCAFVWHEQIFLNFNFSGRMFILYIRA